MHRILIFFLLLGPVWHVAWGRLGPPAPADAGLDSLLQRAKQYVVQREAAALPLLQQALSLARRRADTTRLARGWYLTGLHHLCQYQLHRARRALDSAHRYATYRPRAVELRTLICLNQHAVYEQWGQYDSTFHFAQAAWHLIEAHDTSRLVAPVMLRLGNAYLYLLQDAEALTWYQRAEARARAQGNREMLYQALNNQGALYQQAEVYELAQQYVSQAMAIAATLDSMEYMMISHNLGNLYYRTEEPERAKPFVHDALAYAQRYQRLDYVAKSWWALARIHLAMEQLDSARVCLTQAHRAVDSSQARYLRSSVYRLECELAMHQADWPQAQARLQQARQASQAQPIQSLKAGLMAVQLAARQKQPRQAIALATALLQEQARSLGYAEQLRLYQALADSYTQLNQPGPAQQMQLQAVRYRDTLQQQQIDLLRGNLLAQLEAQQQDRENEALRSENAQQAQLMAQQQRIITLQRITVGGLTGGTLVVLVLLGLLWRAKRRKERLHADLDQLHQQTLVHQQALERHNQTQDQLLSIISHDLRPPITQLGYLIDYLLAGDLTLVQMQHMGQRLRQKVQRTELFLESLLHWATRQADEQAPVLQPVELATVAAEVLDLHEVAAQQKAITLTISLPVLPPVMADPHLMRLVLRNLLHNAIKFTPRGGSVTLTAQRTADRVRIAVRDTGVGLSPAQQAALFGWRSPSQPGTNQETGTGIGLALCQAFVTRMQGRIWVESTEGEGATFWVEVGGVAQ